MASGPKDLKKTLLRSPDNRAEEVKCYATPMSVGGLRLDQDGEGILLDPEQLAHLAELSGAVPSSVLKDLLAACYEGGVCRVCGKETDPNGDAPERAAGHVETCVVARAEAALKAP
jgi:hypothetical protein